MKKKRVSQEEKKESSTTDSLKEVVEEEKADSPLCKDGRQTSGEGGREMKERRCSRKKSAE